MDRQQRNDYHLDQFDNDLLKIGERIPQSSPVDIGKAEPDRERK